MDTLNHNQIIDRLGGTSSVAKLFNIKPASVSGWRENGIPEARLMYLRVVRPDVFEDNPTPPKRRASDRSPRRRATDNDKAS